MSGSTVKELGGHLHRKFIALMKVLFEVLDDKKEGFILLSDLEKWWDVEAGAAVGSSVVSLLPTDVLDALRKVAPSSGRLSFEKFIIGLRISLLKHKQGHLILNDQNGYQSSLDKPKSVEALHFEETTAALTDNRPFRTSSVPHLNTMLPVRDNIRAPESQNFDKENFVDLKKIKMTNTDWNGKEQNLSSGKIVQKDAIRLHMQSSESSFAAIQQDAGKDFKLEDQQKHVSRRHTLTSGVSYNFIPIMKLMQQEKEVLQQGLIVLETARQWYLNQLGSVQEKQKNFEQTSLVSDYSTEANKERIYAEKLRIMAVNREVKSLIGSSEKGFSVDMNLAMTQVSAAPNDSSRDMAMLKLHNQRLTQELAQKTKQISKLEREKIILVKEMFQARSANKNPSVEMTLI